MRYRDIAPEGERLAEACGRNFRRKGYNPHVMLGEYRSITTPHWAFCGGIAAHIKPIS